MTTIAIICLVLSNAFLALLWLFASTDLKRSHAREDNLQTLLRYRKNEIDAVNEINCGLMQSAMKMHQKNLRMQEELKSFARSVIYWKGQTDKATLRSE